VAATVQDRRRIFEGAGDRVFETGLVSGGRGALSRRASDKRERSVDMPSEPAHAGPPLILLNALRKFRALPNIIGSDTSRRDGGQDATRFSPYCSSNG
jgi:hypothetical protein